MRIEDVKFITELCRFIENKKGEDVTLFDLSEKEYIVDYSIAVTALNKKHLYSLVGEVEEFLKLNNHPVHHVEGTDASGWMIVDCYNFLVNIFVKEERDRIKYDDLFVTHR